MQVCEGRVPAMSCKCVRDVYLRCHASVRGACTCDVMRVCEGRLYCVCERLLQAFIVPLGFLNEACTLSALKLSCVCVFICMGACGTERCNL